jgi:uncharacterized protein YfaS (alpha-2-macroglobulin family)
MAVVVALLFGSFSWKPPRWLSRTSRISSEFARLHPRITLLAILTLFFAASGASATLHWYKQRPKPYRVTVEVAPIPVTPLEKDLSFPALVLTFSESTAALEDLKKPSMAGVRLDPSLDGVWRWTNDRTLVFQPKTDWPAEKKFRVIFDKKFFPPHILMERLVCEAKTPPFKIKINEFQLYQDPTNPTQHQLTATLELTHAAEPGELDRHIRLLSVSGVSLFAPSDPAPHFTVTYGMHQRLAYLRSSPIRLPEREDFAKLALTDGTRTKQGGAQTHDGLEQKVRVPSLATMFRIDSSAGTIARNKANEPEQVLVLLTSADISTTELGKALEVRLLPKRTSPRVHGAVDSETGDREEIPVQPAEQATMDSDSEGDGEESEEEAAPSTISSDEKWLSPTDLPEAAVTNAKRIQFTAVDAEKPQARQHAFRIRVEAEGELLVRVKRGVRAPGDYPLAEDYDAVIPVPQMPREVQIEGDGGLLALNGERKLSVRSRGLAAIEYEIARVATSQINHLVSQTRGEFQNPEFKIPYFFNQENISRVALEHQPIAMENKWKANYSAFNFAEHLRQTADGGSERGLFFLTARGWDPVQKKAYRRIADRRFLLVTDIGIVTKKNENGGHDIFLLSIKNQKPIAEANVEILGKNGVPIQTARTDAQGHCVFPSVDKSAHEKTPVAFVARNGEDVAFIPYARADRVLNFSRFDVEGVENSLPENLGAFIFTERGVYRPGDQIHIGLVVKQRNWQGNLKGLPLEMRVLDARGREVQRKRFSLPETGFIEQTYQTASESPLGLYAVNLYLIKNSRPDILLGSTTAQVKEFLPDRMKIETRLSRTAAHGWIDPRDVRGTVALANLYGTAATNRRVTARLELAPTAFRFPEFRDFVFYDPLLDEKKNRQEGQTVELGEKKTDEAGQTQFELQLERFADATYKMQFIAEGFEGEGGRSVTGDATTLVSALPYVIGCKAPSDLNYVEMNQPRALDLVAVDPRLNRIAVENLTLNIIAQEYVSLLTKKESGNYAFESILRERVTKSERITIPANGWHYALPTTEPGNYVFEVRDAQNRRLSRATFCVVGPGAASRSMEKNAELEVKLDRTQYDTGDDIAISITAPYSGSGLITIERDKVYAYQWFQTATPSSIQHIRVPEGFEGSGYINVAFVRALDSKEIFVSPLSYGVVPFVANMEKRRLRVDLQTAATVKPGEPLHISYKTDRPGKIVIFAVDQGILQVTDFKAPDPLAYLFRKCALAVQTSQIVDLIIPEFSILHRVSAFGGGGDIQRLNPFKRVTEKPVVFWSGIVDADTTPREVVYDVPDYFDGTLKVMAVAVSAETTGSSERNTLVRGPFIITPSVPVLVAPGDQFEAGVTVANNVEGSGVNAEIELRAETNDQLLIVGPTSQKLRISEGHEQSFSFRFRVNSKLGGGEIRFIASWNGTEIQRRATLSVRPSVPFMTDVRGGSFNKASVEIPISRQTYGEFRKRSAAVSALPLGLAHGLDVYLKNFPHGCSEQITSGAFCRLLLADEADFGLSRAQINEQLEYTFATQRRRQNNDGSFGYWAPETTDRISFVSVYVMDFLSNAKASGFAPPEEMFSLGLRYLQKTVTQEPNNLFEARTVAYAIYVLTREGVITTNYVLNLRDYLEKNQHDKWQNDITGVYLAGALHILQKDSEAEKLIAKYKLGEQRKRECDDFHQPLGTDSQYIAVLAREFPARLKKISGNEFEAIVNPISEGGFNTLSAAYAVRALKSYSRSIAHNLPELGMTELFADKPENRLTSGARLLQRHDFSGDARAVRFSSNPPLGGPGAFFQVIEAGFDRQMPSHALSNGLEVYRELLGPDNHEASRTRLGEVLRVRLHVRSLQKNWLTNVAVVDLLPGGFEIVDSSLRSGVSGVQNVDFVELREDRAVFFASVPNSAIEIDYQIKSCNRGEFVVPPVFAESMYDRNVKARGVGSHITVTE